MDDDDHRLVRFLDDNHRKQHTANPRFGRGTCARYTFINTYPHNSSSAYPFYVALACLMIGLMGEFMLPQTRFGQLGSLNFEVLSQLLFCFCNLRWLRPKTGTARTFSVTDVGPGNDVLLRTTGPSRNERPPDQIIDTIALPQMPRDRSRRARQRQSIMGHWGPDSLYRCRRDFWVFRSATRAR